jgi:REP element-mobilizing transposase RayT
MQKIEPLKYGQYYHIYNCGINGENLFREAANYEYFLSLYDKYIYPVADTYAWCLMPNHFHLLVRIKAEEEIEATSPDRVLNPVRANKTVKPPHQYFSNLFNSYTQAFNKRYNRHGGLFKRPFKRKSIHEKSYFQNVIIYIHNNPVHHGFSDDAVDYPWSSYLTCVSVKPTHLHRETVIGWFDNLANFKLLHQTQDNIMSLEDWLFSPDRG